MFLTFSQSEHKPATFLWYKSYLQMFCDVYGNKLTSSLIPHHITEWVAAHPDWKGAKRHAKGIVKCAFAWAVREGLVSKNPFADIVVGKAGRRNRVLDK